MRERIRRFKSSSLRQQTRDGFLPIPCLSFLRILEEDLRVGAVLQEQNALPTTRLFYVLFAAKDAIDNGGAGRAAKSGNPLLCANNKNTPFWGVFSMLFACFYLCTLIYVQIVSKIFQRAFFIKSSWVKNIRAKSTKMKIGNNAMEMQSAMSPNKDGIIKNPV